MRNEIISILAWLIEQGYIKSVRITKDNIYVIIKK